MNYFYKINGIERGPVTEHELDRLTAEGHVSTATMVRPEHERRFRMFGELKLFHANAAEAEVTEATCGPCGIVFPMRELADFNGTFVCASCKPEFVQKIKEGVMLMDTRYAGFWVRFLAKIIDTLILWVMLTGIFLVFGIPLYMLSQSPDFVFGTDGGVIVFLQFVAFGVYMMVPALYSALFHTQFGATPGKMAFGLIVVTGESNRIGFGRAVGRSFAEFLSSFIFLIGYVMAGFDDEKRSLHDHIVNTRVIHTR